MRDTVCGSALLCRAGASENEDPLLRAERVVVESALLDLANGTGERRVIITRPRIVLRARAASVTRSTLALLDLVRFAAVVVGAVALALGCAVALDASGFDPRLAKLVAIAVSFTATWLLRSRVVFR